MTRTPPLERDQAPAEAALRLFLDLARAMTSLSLAPRLRELAFVTASRLNRSALCDTFHSSLGRAAGLSEAQLASLPGHVSGPEYSDFERLVIRYAEALTVSGAVDDALHRALAEHLPPKETDRRPRSRTSRLIRARDARAGPR